MTIGRAAQLKSSRRVVGLLDERGSYGGRSGSQSGRRNDGASVPRQQISSSHVAPSRPNDSPDGGLVDAVAGVVPDKLKRLVGDVRRRVGDLRGARRARVSTRSSPQRRSGRIRPGSRLAARAPPCGRPAGDDRADLVREQERLVDRDPPEGPAVMAHRAPARLACANLAVLARRELLAVEHLERVGHVVGAVRAQPVEKSLRHDEEEHRRD